MHRFLLVIALSVLIISSASADDPACKRDGSETFLDCFNNVFAASKSKAKKEAKAAGDKELTRKTTPDEAPDSASSLKDFLPRLITTLGFGDFSEDKDSQTLSFGLGPKSSSKPAMLKIVRREAELFEPMITAIPDTIRNDRKATLEGELEDFDDVEASISVNIEGKIFGRSFGRSLGRYDGITDAVYSAVTPVPDNANVQTLLVLLGQRQVRDAGWNMGTSVQRAYQDKEDLAKDLEAKIIAAALGEVTNLESYRKLLEQRKFFVLADLANNQPQLHVEASYRSRHDRVGPDEWSAKATYEHGFNNINRLISTEQCGDELKDGGEALRTCYEKFVKDNPSNSANRLAFSAEYGETDDYDFELPADMFTFQLDSVEKLLGSAAYGRTLSYNEGRTKDKSRIDFEAKYEDVSGDEMRNDRLVAGATFSQNLLDNNIVSIGVVWASKPEYRGEVDKELSARFGLKFKLDKNEKKE